MSAATLKPQRYASQLDFGRNEVFVEFSTHVIENQPIIQ